MVDLPSSNSSKTISSPKTARKGRMGRWFVNLILIILIVAAGAAFVKAEQKRRTVEKELQKTSAELEQIRKSTQGNGEEIAKEVLAKVRKHIDVPNDPLPTVATITDVNKLKEANEFYKLAENGDNLIITQTRAILYSVKKDLVLDVVPVRLDASPAPDPAAAGAPPAAVPATSTAAVPPAGAPAVTPAPVQP